MMFEIKLKASTYNPTTRTYDFTFDYEVKSIPTKVFRWEDENLTSALSKIDLDEVDDFRSIIPPTFGEDLLD